MIPAHIVVRTSPLARDYNEGEEVVLNDRGKDFRMRLVADAFKGERQVLVIPLDKITQ